MNNIEAASGEDHRWRTGRLHSRKEHYRADLQPKNPLREIFPAPARPLLCLHRLQGDIRQGLACSFVDDHEEVQHQCQPYPSHQTPLWQGHQCSLLKRLHRRQVANTKYVLSMVSMYMVSWYTLVSWSSLAWQSEWNLSPIFALISVHNTILQGESLSVLFIVEF